MLKVTGRLTESLAGSSSYKHSMRKKEQENKTFEEGGRRFVSQCEAKFNSHCSHDKFHLLSLGIGL